MSEEVFGPVIPVVPYQSIEEAMQRINNGPSPLGSYVVTNDSSLANQFVNTIRSGGAAVNCFGLQGGHVALPFGGFGRSGQGCHSGREGFLGYCHTKSVFYGASDSLVHKHLEPPLSTN
jgi:coniferyl-aldehyde dehydrogenase